MAKFHIIAGAHETPDRIAVRRIGVEDLKDSLRRGFQDFWAMPSHLAFLCLLYPIIGIFFAGLAFGNNLLPLLFPLASGFALVGPLAAVGLYELSRRRERGETVRWQDMTEVLRSPSIGSIAALGVLLAVIFLFWLVIAQALYQSLFGWHAPQSMSLFLQEVLTTRNGWTLIVLGNLIGAAFSVAVFAMSVIAFPLLLDRDVGAVVAIQTSVKAVLANPGTMALWGLIVAGALVIGFIPLFIGLAIVLPVLGHATWHLYRKVVPS
ncbi:DUF2189 domain-containing protein [Microvirga pudoricolor]|uniref:DUF2189 domain-containing protein n=1 Tax=Microvirga pudoricolor TaxID=2778729 RepID=UPI00194F55D1|nr:DUF2189 domain-containing protein [Microvirga pudoricolor]MBM6594087.1 DUF2189 domain-containing protein [Microvirga pudoricolor]